MIYSVCDIEVPPGKVNEALASLGEAVSAGRIGGELRACWYAELGRLNRILAISAHPARKRSTRRTQKALAGDNAYGVAGVAIGITLDAFASFPDFDVLPPGSHGPVFEVRTYQLRKAGLAPTLALWAKAIPPRSQALAAGDRHVRLERSVPRFMHIWPFRSLNDRMRHPRGSGEAGPVASARRARAHRAMQSEIFLPAAFSPVTNDDPHARFARCPRGRSSLGAALRPI